MSVRAQRLPIVALVLSLLIAAPAVAIAQSPPPAKEHEVQAALESLKKAESQITNIGGGFGGHRTKALEHIKKAEAELREGLAYAKQNPGKGASAPVKK